MADTRFDEVFEYRRQYEFGSPEYEAVTGLIHLLNDNDVFGDAYAWRSQQQVRELHSTP